MKAYSRSAGKIIDISDEEYKAKKPVTPSFSLPEEDVYQEPSNDADYFVGTPDDVNTPDVTGNAPPPEVQPKKDLSETIGDTILGVIDYLSKPFKRTGKNIVAATVQTPLMIAEGKARAEAGNPNLPDWVRQTSQKGADTLEKARKALEPIGRTEEGFKNISENKKDEVIRGLKDSANILSYAIPFGKGTNFLTKATLPGAGVGALQELTGEEETTLPKVIGAGALGAGASTAFHALGKLISATHNAVTKKFPEKVMQTTFKEPIKATKAALKKGESLGELALEKGEIGTTESIYAKALTRTEQLEDELQKILMDSDDVVDMKVVKKAVNPLLNKLLQAGDKESARALITRIDDIIEVSGTKIPVSQANEIKRTIYKELRRQYGTPGSAGVEGLKDIARVIKEEIGKVNGVGDINKNLSYYGRVTDSMANKMVSEGRRNIIGLTDTILAAGFGAQSIPIIAGKALLGSTIGKTALAQGLSKYGAVGTKIGETITKTLGNIPQQTVSRLPSAIEKNPAQPRYEQSESYTTDSNLPHTPGIIPQTGKKDYVKQYQAIYNKYLKYQQDPRYSTDTKFKSAVDSGYANAVDQLDRERELTGGADLTADEKTRLMEAKVGLGLVDVLEKQYNAVYEKGLTAQQPGLGRLGGLKGEWAAFTQSSTEAAAYNKTVGAFLARLARSTGEKGTLNEGDMNRIKNAIPHFTDTKEVADEQWRLIREIIGGAIRAKEGYEQSSLPSTPQDLSMGVKKKDSLASKILPIPAPITQTFGQKSKYDVFSGNTNYGVDFAVPSGTPINAPQGNWKVVETYAKSPNKGYIGNATNRGYGNSVTIQNMDTGERLRFSHLSQVNVKPGQTISGQQIGLSGRSGNVTGDHADIEYYKPNGQIADVMNSQYGKLLSS